jgi:hypothetical protein
MAPDTQLQRARKFLAHTFCLAVLAPAAMAGRPLSTEDAGTLEHGRCQVEAWMDRSSVNTTAWLVPACNVGAGIEWQVGFARSREAGAHRFSDAYAQGKTVFKSLEETSPWAVGLVAGVVRHPQYAEQRGWEHPYFLVPLTIASGTLLTHANLGWSRDREKKRDLALWGLAVEQPVSEAVTLVAEAYGENTSRPFLRAGGRFTAIKDVLDFDLTYVARARGERAERFVSIGVFWQSGRFLQ